MFSFIEQLDLDLRTLSLLCSPGCNLQCNYCQMAKQIHTDKKKQLWDDTILALQDGTYLKNIVKSLERLTVPKGQINRIELWGQEPTLTLQYFTEHWEEWYETLYGMEVLFFSTNGMGDSQVIIDFIKKADEVFAEHTDPIRNKFSVEIQLSYDGPYGEDIVRGGCSQILLDNFLKLEKAINAYEFKSDLNIRFCLHSVVSTDLIKHLNTISKVEEWFSGYHDFYTTLLKANNSNRVEWSSPAFMYQNCYDATTQDGIELATFLKCANYIKDLKLFPGTMIDDLMFNFVVMLLGNSGEGTLRLMRDFNYTNFNYFIDDYFENPQHPQKLSLDTCSTGISDLKILYDGQIVMCQNSIYDTRIDTDLLDDSVDNQARYHFMTHGQTINLITSTDEEIEHFYNYILGLRKPSNFLFTYSCTSNLMYLMAKNGQIDPTYCHDLQKLKRHAYLLSRICWCFYNTEVMSGSIFVRAAGEIRQLCNGVLDVLDEFIDQDLQRRNR